MYSITRTPRPSEITECVRHDCVSYCLLDRSVVCWPTKQDITREWKIHINWQIDFYVFSRIFLSIFAELIKCIQRWIPSALNAWQGKFFMCRLPSSSPVQWKNKKNKNKFRSFGCKTLVTAHTAHNSMVYDVQFLCVPWPLKAIVKMMHERARCARASIFECTCGVASHQGSSKVIKIAYTNGKFSTYAWFLHRNDNIIAFHRVFAQCA